jgi:membrane-associated protein
VLGALLGQVTLSRSDIEFILIGIGLVSVVPIAIELLRALHRAYASAPGV